MEKNSKEITESYRAGFVAICGRPNVGKSTLMNRLLGEALSIISAKPQTTRQSIRGILSRPEGQLIFVDTPGILGGKTPRRQKALQKFLREEAQAGLEGADVAVFILDAEAGFTREDESLWTSLKTGIARSGIPLTLVLNKVDAVADKTKLLGIIAELSTKTGIAEIFPCSARTRDGTEALLMHLISSLPISPPLYPVDLLSDQNDRLLVAEVIRERIFALMGEELPYSSAVRVDRFKEEPEIIRLSAEIFVERDSQKGMVIGKGGHMLKRIGSEARLKLERHFAKKIFLELHVKVLKNWSDDERKLKMLGYVLPNEPRRAPLAAEGKG